MGKNEKGIIKIKTPKTPCPKTSMERA